MSIPDEQSVTLFGQSLPSEVYDVLDLSCSLNIFSEVLDTYPFVQQILFYSPTVFWTLLVSAAMKIRLPFSVRQRQ